MCVAWAMQQIYQRPNIAHATKGADSRKSLKVPRVHETPFQRQMCDMWGVFGKCCFAQRVRHCGIPFSSHSVWLIMIQCFCWARCHWT